MIWLVLYEPLYSNTGASVAREVENKPKKPIMVKRIT